MSDGATLAVGSDLQTAVYVYTHRGGSDLPKLVRAILRSRRSGGVIGEVAWYSSADLLAADAVRVVMLDAAHRGQYAVSTDFPVPGFAVQSLGLRGSPPPTTCQRPVLVIDPTRLVVWSVPAETFSVAVVTGEPFETMKGAFRVSFAEVFAATDEDLARLFVWK